MINLSLQQYIDPSQIDVIVAFMIILAFLISIALHECGHALLASWLGDTTPRAEGRQTLSFRPHIDPVGLLMCIILAFQPIGAPPVGLGWGKPVYTNNAKLKGGLNGLALVALAGPFTYTGLTRHDPTAPRGELASLYPSGQGVRRTFRRREDASSGGRRADLGRVADQGLGCSHDLAGRPRDRPGHPARRAPRGCPRRER